MIRFAGVACLARIATAAALAATALAASGAGIAPADRRSGYAMMAPETRRMQDDDAENPGMLWVLDGRPLWTARPAPDAASCAECHGDAETSMKGVAARYPAFDDGAGHPVDLAQRINRCRVLRQRQAPWAGESRELLALEAYVALQSRGVPIAIDAGPRMQPYLRDGRAEFERRRGQLNLACSQCHEDRWGLHLGGSVIPQAHPTAYPIYRLEWQSVGSLRRRLRGCMIAVRSEPYDAEAPQMIDLELYLAWRARGMTFEAPGVRP